MRESRSRWSRNARPSDEVAFFSGARPIESLNVLRFDATSPENFGSPLVFRPLPARHWHKLEVKISEKREQERE